MKFVVDESMDLCTKISKEPLSKFYGMLSELGRGKFAVVKRCLHLSSGEERAAKIQRKRRKAVDCRLEILQEMRMLEAVRGHPNIIQLIEVFETNHEIIIITEFVGGGELGNHLLMQEWLNERDTIHVTSEVLQALVYLHGKQLVHMDLKPQNLLLMGSLPDCRVKLCDFGLMRSVDGSSVIREIIGTPDYVAPEVLDYEPLQTACDIWSLGVLVYVLLTGFSPFSGETKQELYLNISQVNLDFPSELFDSVSSSAMNFIRSLLVKNPANRPSASDCLQSVWIVHSADGASSSSSSLSCLKGSPVSCVSPSVDTMVPDIQVSRCVVPSCDAPSEHTPRKRSRSSNRLNDETLKGGAADGEDKENNQALSAAFHLRPIKSPKMSRLRHGTSFRMRPKQLHEQLKQRRSHSLKYLSPNSPLNSPVKRSSVTMTMVPRPHHQQQQHLTKPVQSALFTVTVAKQINE